MQFGADPLDKGLSDARFADAGLAGDQHNAPLAGLGLLPSAQKQVDLLVATDKGCSSRAQRFEAAIDGADAGYLPDLHRTVEALEGQGTKRGVFEEVTEEAAGIAVDHHRVRCGQRLKSRRKVGGLADHFRFVRWVISYKIADNHKTSGDADPHLQSGSRSGVGPRFGANQYQSRAHRALSIVLMRLGVAEIGENPVAHISGDETTVFNDDIRGMSMIGTDDSPEVLGVEPCRKCGRTNEITEHDGQVATLRSSLPTWLGRELRRGERHPVKFGDRAQHLATMT